MKNATVNSTFLLGVAVGSMLGSGWTVEEIVSEVRYAADAIKTLSPNSTIADLARLDALREESR